MLGRVCAESLESPIQFETPSAGEGCFGLLSVFVRQQNRGHRPIPLGDDVEANACAGGINREESVAVREGTVIPCLVSWFKIAPVARTVASHGEQDLIKVQRVCSAGRHTCFPERKRTACIGLFERHTFPLLRLKSRNQGAVYRALQLPTKCTSGVVVEIRAAHQTVSASASEGVCDCVAFLVLFLKEGRSSLSGFLTSTVARGRAGYAARASCSLRMTSGGRRREKARQSAGWAYPLCVARVWWLNRSGDTMSP